MAFSFRISRNTFYTALVTTVFVTPFSHGIEIWMDNLQVPRLKAENQKSQKRVQQLENENSKMSQDLAEERKSEKYPNTNSIHSSPQGLKSLPYVTTATKIARAEIPFGAREVMAGSLRVQYVKRRGTDFGFIIDGTPVRLALGEPYYYSAKAGHMLCSVTVVDFSTYGAGSVSMDRSCGSVG